MASRIIKKNLDKNLLDRFPKSNKNYLPVNNTCTSLVKFGENLTSTVGYPKFTSIIRHMVQIPRNKYGLLVGILISDGWLQINKAGNTRLSLKQSIDNFEYLFNVYNQLAHYCSAPPKLVKTTLNSKSGKKTFYAVSFTTRTYPAITELYAMFYENNKKIVPKNLYDLLTYEALAHWICGDGTYTFGGVTLQTQSFTIQEVVHIINVLIVKFDLKCSMHMQRGQPILYISVESMKKILPQILPYICDGMKYKVTGVKTPK